MNAAAKESELPAPDSCAIMEGEDAEDELIFASKKSLLGKIKAFTSKVGARQEGHGHGAGAGATWGRGCHEDWGHHKDGDAPGGGVPQEWGCHKDQGCPRGWGYHKDRGDPRVWGCPRGWEWGCPGVS